MYKSRPPEPALYPTPSLLLLSLSACGPSAEELKEQQQHEQAQKAKDAAFDEGFRNIVSIREHLVKVAAAWPDAAKAPASGPCTGAADTMIIEFESIARFGQPLLTNVEGKILTDRSSMPFLMSYDLDMQRRRAEVEAKNATEKVAALAEDDWLRFRGHALRGLEPIRSDLNALAAAPRTAVFRAAKLVPPQVIGDDHFVPGLYSGALVIFDNQSGAALCGGPLEATNRAGVSELRMDGVPLTDAVLADLIGQAYQAAVAQVAALAPGGNLVPPAN